MRENIFQQIVACTWWKDGQIELIFNENKDEFLSRRCHQQMEEKLQVSHLADLTACFAAMLEVVRAGYPLNFGTSQFLLKIYPVKVYRYDIDCEDSDDDHSNLFFLIFDLGKIQVSSFGNIKDLEIGSSASTE